MNADLADQRISELIQTTENTEITEIMEKR